MVRWLLRRRRLTAPSTSRLRRSRSRGSSPRFRPSATLVIDSTKVNAPKLAELEDILYGTDDVTPTDPRLPLPAEIIALFAT
jgi:hypothetical protein